MLPRVCSINMLRYQRNLSSYKQQRVRLKFCSVLAAAFDLAQTNRDHHRHHHRHDHGQWQWQGTSQWPTTRKPFSEISHLPSPIPYHPVPFHPNRGSHLSIRVSEYFSVLADCCAVVLCEVCRIQSTRKLNQGPRKSWHNLMSAQWETLALAWAIGPWPRHSGIQTVGFVQKVSRRWLLTIIISFMVTDGTSCFG